MPVLTDVENKFDELVPDPQVCKELSVSAMTIWRWDRDPQMAALGWAPPIRINKRKYRSRKQFEKFKRAVMKNKPVATTNRVASASK
jgi:hypothetical protein